MIFANQVSSIEGEIPSVVAPDVPPEAIKSGTIEKREKMALLQAEFRLNALNTDVDQTDQSLFDKINFIFPQCVWNGRQIVVVDKYRIDPPYTTVNVISSEYEGDDGHVRLIKMLEGFRKKLGLT